MAIYSGFPSDGSKDYDGYSSTNTYLMASANVDGVTKSYADVILNTSAVVGKIITAATLTFWNQIVVNAGNLVTSIHLYNSLNGQFDIHAYSRTSGPANHRYVTTALTSSQQLSAINGSGGTETAVRFSVNTPPSLDNKWMVNAYESGSTVCTRIGVRYDEPPESYRRRPFIIC